MKQLVFFTENKWAFGSIHHALCKLLYPYGFNCEVLDFFVKYQQNEIQQIDRNTDLFVTTPPGAVWLLEYGIDPEKIYAVAHAQWDILLAQQRMGLNFNKLKKYAVVSEILLQKSKQFGITRVPDVTPLGIFFDRFYHKPCEQLTAVGYAAAWQSQNFWGQEIKRGYLVRSAADSVELPLQICNQYHYLAMSEFYNQVGCIVMSSVEEGAGLPMMEAAAAGRLCIGTPVGYFEHNGPAGGGVTVPIDAAQFVAGLTGQLTFYKQNPDAYRRKCDAIQQYARAHYDWTNFIEPWAKFLQ